MRANTSTPVRLSSAAVRPLRTLDPAGPLNDLEWLDEAIGAARVVAIGESAHYNGESYRLRHRLLRYLVERHGFSACAMESGFVEGQRTDAWVRGGADRLDDVLAHGLTSLMGLWAPMRAHLEWMRQHNRDAARPVGFYGIDLPGSNASLLPGLDAVLAHLGRADPGFVVDPAVRDTAAAFAAPSPFSAPAALAAYVGLAPAARDALTAGLADLAAHLSGHGIEHARRTTADEHERALRSLHLTATLDAVVRALARGDHRGGMQARDAAMADTVGWILQREDRIVLAAHDDHIQRWPVTVPGLPPLTMLGTHLADRLGAEYVVIGTTTGTGRTLNTGADFAAGTLFTDLGPPRPGSLDALMAASGDEPFATDLRRLPPQDAAVVRAAAEQRSGSHYGDLDPLQAYDVVVHLPRVTAARPDPGALARSPVEVQEAFTRWTSGATDRPA